MQIGEERLKEFMRVYKDAYGQEIALAEARETAQRLLTLFEILRRPLPGERGKHGSLGFPAQTEP